MSRQVADTAGGRGPGPGAPEPVVPDEQAAARRRKTEEFRTWFFLTFVMAPLLAVAIVSAYGFAVWLFQLVAGPPGS
ncbi:MAG: periplasmic nitrate reductase, NapE protein [Ramlibacter sp.]